MQLFSQKNVNQTSTFSIFWARKSFKRNWTPFTSELTRSFSLSQTYVVIEIAIGFGAKSPRGFSGPIGWYWMSGCKCTHGCRYQSIFDLTQPPNPCMERQTTTLGTTSPTFVSIISNKLACVPGISVRWQLTVDALKGWISSHFMDI